MIMPPFSQQNSADRVPENPEIYAGSLAHILHREAGKVAVVGQAWLAGANKLVTCGHVVEPFLNDSAMLLVKFPASGAEYSIDSMELHPNFGRQEDQLVKYDVAVLSVRLRGQELASTALPLRFEQELKNQESLWTVRYPAHLGALTSAPDPLKQSGRFLGRLRKQDNFHLLHDLALSPGDSGAALFSDQGVVGIHCGDTASLPGLNLPTTSIRLALWIDALKDLGIERNVFPPPVGQKRSLLYKICTFVLASGLALGAAMAALAAIYDSELKSAQSSTVKPIDIAFERVTPKDDRIGAVKITPSAPCHLYVVFRKSPDKTFVLYPNKESIMKDELATAETDVSLPEDLRADWQKGAGNLVMIAVKPSQRLIAESDMLMSDGKTFPLIGNTEAFWNKVKENQASGMAICQDLSPQKNAPPTIKKEMTAKDPAAAAGKNLSSESGPAQSGAGPNPSSTSGPSTSGSAAGAPQAAAPSMSGPPLPTGTTAGKSASPAQEGTGSPSTAPPAAGASP